MHNIIIIVANKSGYRYWYCKKDVYSVPAFLLFLSFVFQVEQSSRCLYISTNPVWLLPQRVKQKGKTEGANLSETPHTELCTQTSRNIKQINSNITYFPLRTATPTVLLGVAMLATKLHWRAWGSHLEDSVGKSTEVEVWILKSKNLSASRHHE